MNAESQAWDVIIIGAGIYGIQFARTYLELHPSRRIVVVEASGSVGGVWSKDRVYDEFWTQTPIGLLEFSDQPIDAIPKEDRYFGFFKAHHVATYLENYCEIHVYNGSSLRSRIHTNSPVTSVRRKDKSWQVETASGSIYAAPYVVDASGLTSIPNFPHLSSRDLFPGRILHSKDFARWEHEEHQLRQQPLHEAKNILVLGGAKSAADIAYACARRGDNVSWLIRRSGSGPAAFVSAKGKMGYANSNEAFYTRLTALFLASVFAVGMGYLRLLGMINGTKAGQWLLRRIWQRINAQAWKEADYDREDGHANGFYNLKPDTELFWQNDSTGVNQRPDFFDVIARQVSVVREDLSSLCEEGVALENGEVLKADVIFCATGWRTAHPYFDDQQAAHLGLPVSVHALSSDQKSHLATLDVQAEHKILTAFPLLDSAWAHTNASTNKSPDKEEDDHHLTPFRLWHSILPPHDPTLLFLGKLMLGNHFRNAEAQALFACSILDGTLNLPPLEEMERDVALTLNWCRRRYPRKGGLGNWLYWDLVPYTDLLLARMGLSSHRDASSWWRDLVRPCFARDLRGLIEEYRKKY